MDQPIIPARVLLIDDDDSLLDALSQMLKLRFKDIAVDTYDSAAAALASADLDDYDAIISDIKMPGVDGLELLEKTNLSCPEVPVLLITGHGETDLAIRALRANAFDLVRKPIEREYLAATLSKAIELRRLRRDVRMKQVALERHAEDLEKRVQERTIELRRASQAKDEFLGLVSHELRTPLTVIVGSLDIMERHRLLLTEEEKQELNVDLRLQSHRLQRIIENLLVLARSESGAKARTERVSLNQAIENQLRSHRRSFPERQVKSFLLDDVFVQSDVVYLELILGNLLSNAEKYSSGEEPIEIKVTEDDEFALVAVLDRGRGLSAQEASLVFEPFYRSEEARMIPGAGVGLTVCRRLVESHGGTISAAARTGGGSEFSFKLPLARDLSAPRAAENLENSVLRLVK
jgi:signal transduction histidine kinase